MDKINTIRTGLEEIQKTCGTDLEPEVCLVADGASLSCFEDTTEDEVRKVILSSASKTCCLDPIPTHVLKQCLEVLLPVITKIINLSFRSAKVPNCFKIAAVIPLLKKIILDPEVLKNLRPVSTLPFVSKTMEKVAGKRMQVHKKENKLNEKMQSAYRDGHSTETALLRIQNDVLRDIDSKRCVFLVLLDLSAAFDTVDHQILLTRLSERFGIEGRALQWITSYLSDRKQFVVVNGTRSQEHSLDCNVPQGSVLGPGLFGDYGSPIGDIFRKHGIEFHIYADDTQVYLSFPVEEEAQALTKLEDCIAEVRLWMAKNYLKLNDEKTDFIILGSKHNLKKVTTSHVTIGDAKIVPSEYVKNIGACLDKEMQLEKQVTLTCKSAWYNLYQLSKIRRYLSQEQLQSVIQAFVISKLDQNNALLIGSPKQLTSKLQSIQNAAAKLIYGIKRYDHVKAPLQKLHWLPVEFRIKFKILLLCYKCMYDNGPAYLKELLIPYVPSRSLRSSSSNQLTIPKTALKRYGDRAFSVAGPVLWNSLPASVKDCQSVASFKRNLKTYFFKIAYAL